MEGGGGAGEEGVLANWLDWLKAELSREEVPARTEIPGGGGEREIIPFATLSPPEELLH